MQTGSQVEDWCVCQIQTLPNHELSQILQTSHLHFFVTLFHGLYNDVNFDIKLPLESQNVAASNTLKIHLKK